MLEHEAIVPDDAREGAPLVVLLHGRGADRRDLLGLAEALPPEAVLVTPQAPHPGGPWGYGGGWAWYRYAGEDRVVSETLADSLRMLGPFLAELPSLLPVATGPLVLGGFSQGGTVSLAHALRNPGAVDLVLNFSGFLVDDPLVEVSRESVAGSRLFWGHGIQDPAIPHTLAFRGRTRLREVGADLIERDYAIGHWIAPEEAGDAAEEIRAVAAEARKLDGLAQRGRGPAPAG